MPAKPRIRTVTYSKESKKAPGYALKPGNYGPLRIGCIPCPPKRIYLSSILFGGYPNDNGAILFSDGPHANGLDLFGGIPDSSFLLGGTPLTNGGVLSGNGPGYSGSNLPGGNI